MLSWPVSSTHCVLMELLKDWQKVQDVFIVLVSAAWNVWHDNSHEKRNTRRTWLPGSDDHTREDGSRLWRRHRRTKHRTHWPLKSGSQLCYWLTVQLMLHERVQSSFKCNRSTKIKYIFNLFFQISIRCCPVWPYFFIGMEIVKINKLLETCPTEKCQGELGSLFKYYYHYHDYYYYYYYGSSKVWMPRVKNKSFGWAANRNQPQHRLKFVVTITQ